MVSHFKREFASTAELTSRIIELIFPHIETDPRAEKLFEYANDQVVELGLDSQTGVDDQIYVMPIKEVSKVKRITSRAI
jgi:hypothetical protein